MPLTVEPSSGGGIQGEIDGLEKSLSIFQICGGRLVHVNFSEGLFRYNFPSGAFLENNAENLFVRHLWFYSPGLDFLRGVCKLRAFPLVVERQRAIYVLEGGFLKLGYGITKVSMDPCKMRQL